MEPQTTMQSRCCDEFDRYTRRQRTWRSSRRDFLKTTVGLVAGTSLLPSFFFDSAFADRLQAGPSTEPILVVIQLAGGNDGLNTIVPYASDLYYHNRPNISVPAKSVLPLDNQVGLNPNLQPLKALYDRGKMAIVQGVGYPNPDRSHFRSTSIWESADPVGVTPTGWLGRYLDTTLADVNNPLKAVAIGSSVPQTFNAERTSIPSIESIDSFRFLLGRDGAKPILDAYRTMYGGSNKDIPPYVALVRQVASNADRGVQSLQSISTGYKPTVQYPPNPLGRELQLVSQIISTGLGTRVFHVSLNGFDDHVAEVYTHANLLKSLASSLSAFYQDLEAQGKADQVVIMTFSEFGRRVHENAGRGTDHGTAAPLFVLGNKVKGGLYGTDPVLGSLDTDGDLQFGVDFRSVYGTILDGWMGGDSRSVLGGSFDRLPFL